ncbi:MFS transporter [Flavobacterium selenitireducens]|uniref:MFS transporter n=1 Tax=Flavobacterium selenitireducens TaxID=2722704 RepID=UPI00168A7403|nr:MFS transporter [Flavobacterium selenitireducens]MBD3581711.1 MFS transporter [Flavobacterium selenitireducens]
MKKELVPLMLGGLTIGITEFVLMGLLPDIARDLEVSIPEAGHLIATYALGVVIGAPALVILGRNFAPKKMLLWLAFALALLNGLSIIAPNYEFLLLTRLLSGLPHGAFFGVGAVVASRLADKGKEAQAVSIMFAGLTLANVIGVPIGTYIGHHLNWRYTFAIIAVIGFLTLLSMYFLMPNLEKQQSEGIRTQIKFFGKIEAWLIILITAVGFGGLFCWISYIAPLLTKVSLFSEDSVPYIMMLAGLGMLVGNVIGGKLADKFSPAKAVLTLQIVMAAVLVSVFLFSENQYATLVLVFLTGCTAFAMAAPIQMLMIQTAKGAEMLASAAIQASFNIGNALGAFLGGLPIVFGYGFASPNLVGVVMSLLGAVVVLVFLARRNVRLV